MVVSSPVPATTRTKPADQTHDPLSFLPCRGNHVPQLLELFLGEGRSHVRDGHVCGLGDAGAAGNGGLTALGAGWTCGESDARCRREREEGRLALRT